MNVSSRIIADQNVWYSITEGKYDMNRIRQLPLCLTAMNLIEMFGKKLRYNQNLVIKTARLIKKINPIFIEYPAYEYILKKILGRKMKVGKVKLNWLDKLIEGKLDPTIIQDIIKLSYERVDIFKQDIDEQQLKNKKDKQIKEILKDSIAGMNAMANDTILELERLFKISRVNSNRDFVLKNQNNLTFYLMNRYQFSKRITLKNEKAQKNDQFDLLYMVYVRENDFYWTEEKKWIKNVKDAKLDKYLFEYK